CTGNQGGRAHAAARATGQWRPPSPGHASVKLACHLATLGPVGYAPFAPATVASAVVTLVGWFTPPPLPAVTFTLLMVGTAVAVAVCGQAEKTLGHDAKPIVADEVVGQSLALLFVPHRPIAFLVAFLLFRLFDVWKPLGARQT